MTLQDLGSIGELLAAIATLATLIYLAAQIRQNTRAIRHQTSSGLVKANSDATFMITTEPELANIFLRGVQDRQALSEEEQLRFNSYLFGYINQVDYAYEQYLAGTLDERSWQKLEREIPIYLTVPGINEWWQQDKVRFSKEFAAYVDAKIEGLDPTLKAPTLPDSLARKAKSAT